MCMNRIYQIIFGTAFLIAVFLMFLSIYETNVFSENEQGNETAEIKRVIDGDTVVLENEERVRLLGFDSEEEGEKCFDPATEKFKELLDEDENVKLVHQGTDNRDVYGRLLRHIFQHGENLNLKMVEKGYGVVERNEGDKFMDDFIQAEKEAWQNRRGCVWEGYEKYHVCDSEKYIGDWKVLEGKIHGTHDFGEGFYLNFESEFPDNCFTAVVWREEVIEKLGDLENEEVKLHGRVEEYRETPQVHVDRRSQLKVR